MSKKMLIDASVPDETRVVLLGDQGKILDVDFDNVERRQIKSNIYLARVTRVEPSLQAAFVDYGGNRHGFLPFSEIHPDYFQIPIADRERLMEEAREHRESKRRSKAPAIVEEDEVEEEAAPTGRSKRRGDSRKDKAESQRRRKRPAIGSDDVSDTNDDAQSAGSPSDAQADGAEASQAERLDLPVYSDETEQPHVALPVGTDAEQPSQQAEGSQSENTQSENTQSENTQSEGDPSEASKADDQAAGDNTVDASSDESPNDSDAQTPRSQAMTSRPEDLEDSLVGDVGDVEAAPSDSADDTDAQPQADDTASGEPNLAAELERMIEPRGRRRRPGKGKTGQTRGKKRPGQSAEQDSKGSDEQNSAASQSEEQVSAEAVADDEITSQGAQGAGAADGRSDATDEPADARSNQAKAKDQRGNQTDEEDEDDELVEAYREEGDDEIDEDEDDDKDDEQDEVRLSHAFLARRYKIQEVIKRRQIMLIQINKEERGNKGAALTTYLSLPGRYCVLMPNTPKGGGISRKISNPRDRRKLKQILEELSLPTSLSVIVRTAGSKQEKAEIKRDYEYLLRTWDEIRKTTLESTAPALIYEEGNIIKRAVRDMYTTDCSEIVVEGKRGYDIARKMMGNLMPDQLDKVQLHDDASQSVMQVNGVESKLEDLHKPSVALKSGGYLVINQTEALVAIDINSGKATRERSIEDTALKTNLEAADEIARQLRLRQMAGLVVIDFIDMEERRHNRQVEKRLRDALANDRARIQVGQISNFGLLELSRQRLGPSLHEIYRTTCEHCGGLGHVRGSSAVVRAILRSLEAAMRQQEGAEKVSITCSTRLGMDLLNDYRRQLSELEDRYSMRVEVKLNPDFHAEDFDISEASGSGNKRRRTESSSNDEDSGEQRRSKPSRSREDRRSKPRSEARDVEVEDNSDDDEDEDSKARRRRGRRGGRKRRRSDDDGELENGNSAESESDDDDSDNDNDETDRSRGARRGRNQRNERNGRRRREERKPFFARSFDELLNTDREPRDRRQRGENGGRGGRNQRQDRNRQPELAESFDDLLNTDRELRDRRARGDRRRRSKDEQEQNGSSQTQASQTQASQTQAGQTQAGQTQASQTQAGQTLADAVTTERPEANATQAPEAQEAQQANQTQAPAAQPARVETLVEPVAEIAVEPEQDRAEQGAAIDDQALDENGATSEATNASPDSVEADAVVEDTPKPDKPKRRGWWNLGR